jgi:hypothetical protein
VLLCQKASNALPDNEFVETEIKLPAGLVRKCGSGDAGFMQLAISYNFTRGCSQLLAMMHPLSLQEIHLRSKRPSRERS